MPRDSYRGQWLADESQKRCGKRVFETTRRRARSSTLAREDKAAEHTEREVLHTARVYQKHALGLKEQVVDKRERAARQAAKLQWWEKGPVEDEAPGAELPEAQRHAKRGDGPEAAAAVRASADGAVRTGVTLQTRSLGAAKRDAEGWTPLHHAAYSGGAAAVAALLAAGAPVDDVNGDGSTALHLAAWAGDAEAVRHLANKGARMSPVDGKRLTPLHLACAFGNAKAALALVDLGAAVNARDAAGLKPADLAAKRGHASLAARLPKLSLGGSVRKRTAQVNRIWGTDARVGPLDRQGSKLSDRRSITHGDRDAFVASRTFEHDPNLPKEPRHAGQES